MSKRKRIRKSEYSFIGSHPERCPFKKDITVGSMYCQSCQYLGMIRLDKIYCKCK